MINLLPPEQKQAIKFGRLNLVLMQYIILALITIVALLAIVVLGAQKLASVQNDIETQVNVGQTEVDSLKGYHDEAKKISGQIDTLSKLFAQEIRFSGLLKSIGSVMPSGSVLTQLSLNEDRTLPINITAMTTSEETAAVLRKNLEESEIFEKADILTITAQEDENSRYKYQVTITAVFSEEKES